MFTQVDDLVFLVYREDNTIRDHPILDVLVLLLIRLVKLVNGLPFLLRHFLVVDKSSTFELN